MTQDWPIADLDPVRRLRVLASAVPGIAAAETVLPVPFDQAWGVASDLERVLPTMIRDFRSVRVIDPVGADLRLLARGRFGQRARFDVTVRPGWCWMQSRLWVGGLAATAEADGTRLGFVGGMRIGGRVARLFGGTANRMATQALERLAGEISVR